MNAIILAAGKGTRLYPLTQVIPKPLTVINGQPIIERQILYLREIGVQDIYVVAGYKAECFEYLIRKYGINIIFNLYYEVYNNLYSLYLCKEIIGDSYIIEGDIFFCRNFLLPSSESSAYFSGVKQHLTGEWILRYEKKRLTDIIIYDGQPEYKDGAPIMSGISYWTPEDAATIKRHLEKVVENKILFHHRYKQQYWDFIIYKNLQHFSIQVVPINSNDWYEIDTLLNLKEVTVHFPSIK